jgi:hypothetical protein
VKHGSFGGRRARTAASSASQTSSAVIRSRSVSLFGTTSSTSGPGAGDEGGKVVISGTPEFVAHSGRGKTAQYLR